MKPREMSVIYAAVNRLYSREKISRRELLEQPRAGDVGALCILRERYRLRLPLVEARLGLRLPWNREDGATSSVADLTAANAPCLAA
jgi:hypothetical protein